MQKNINNYIDTQGGCTAFAKSINKPLPTIRAWYYGQKAPRPKDAKLLIEYSEGGLTWAGIYDYYLTKQSKG